MKEKIRKAFEKKLSKKNKKIKLGIHVSVLKKALPRIKKLKKKMIKKKGKIIPNLN